MVEIVNTNDVKLEQLNSIKDSGDNFDSLLKFDKHIDDKIGKAYSFLGIIKRIVRLPIFVRMLL